MKPCPVCQKPAVEGFKPFCSGRCADVDLHRWFGETYRVPVKEDEDEDGQKESEDEN
ncbi:MAG: DNA gyrase inhibitor YacG [Proteobacteria bacterium]|nr:DNA gyrase inhibitor YacG [Pseudomonadota bacterium]